MLILVAPVPLLLPGLPGSSSVRSSCAPRSRIALFIVLFIAVGKVGRGDAAQPARAMAGRRGCGRRVVDRCRRFAGSSPACTFCVAPSA
jgi:hypothetical protein